MSTVHAFFSQRKKDLASGTATSDTATAEKVFGAATPAVAPAKRTFHVAVQGCCHGELSRIYDACAAHERETQKKIDFLVCCGDFQSTRTMADVASMAVPDKYKTVGDFPKYYSPVVEGVSTAATDSAPPHVAPYLTLFVGGNHENSDWLAEESYGGFLAPNIYYVGHSGVVEVDGKLRVAGLSGIFKAVDYNQPYPPERPYSGSERAKRSAYHVRRVEQEKLMCYCRARQLIQELVQQEQQQLSEKEEKLTSPEATSTTSRGLVDVVVSHDWPTGITKYGNEEQLLKYKPYFRDEVEHNALGNPHSMSVLRAARPQYWLAAHLHCFFTAKVPHSPGASAGAASATQFMALDKCAKGKGFLDFVDIPIVATGGESHDDAGPIDKGSSEKNSGGNGDEARFAAAAYVRRVRRDPLWLEVLKRSHSFLVLNRTGPGGFDAETEAQSIAKAYMAGELEADGEAPFAPTTASLLRALGLAPAAPLQLPRMAWGEGAPESRGGDGGGGNRVGQRGQPPRGLHPDQMGRTCCAKGNQVSPPPAPSPVTETRLEPLGWAEDIG